MEKFDKLDMLLLGHEIYPGNSGYGYLKWILTNIKDDISNISITKVYEKVAEKFETRKACVERNLRYELRTCNIKGTNKKVLALLQIEYRSSVNEK